MPKGQQSGTPRLTISPSHLSRIVNQPIRINYTVPANVEYRYRKNNGLWSYVGSLNRERSTWLTVNRTTPGSDTWDFQTLISEDPLVWSSSQSVTLTWTAAPPPPTPPAQKWVFKDGTEMKKMIFKDGTEATRIRDKTGNLIWRKP